MYDPNINEAEFSSHNDAAKKIIDGALAANRDITDSEKTTLDEMFAKMESLNRKKVAQDKTLSQAFNSGSSPKDYNDMILGRKPMTRSWATVGQKVGGYGNPLAYDQSFASALGTESDNSLSLGECCRAMVIGARSYDEATFLNQNSDSSGGFTMPPSVSAATIDVARANSAFIQAGAKTIPLIGGTGRLMRLTENAAPIFRAEHADVPSGQVFTDATFNLKTIGVIIRASRELLEDAINVDQAINDAFATAISAELDRVIGWGAGGVEPLGIASNTDILTLASAGANGNALADYSRLLDALYRLNLAQTQPTSVLMSPREARTLNGFVDSQENPLRRPDSLSTLNYFVSPNVPVNQTQGTSNVASSMIMGDFSKLLIGMNNSLRVEVIKERYADKLEYGFQAWMRVDAQLLRPKAFCKITGIIP